ncbi:MAG TPA: GGDEF domain-containing protein, partial [Polyangiaceae bacterium]
IGSNTVLKFSLTDELEEQFQKSIYEQATRDGLTRVYNKKYFLDTMRKEFAYCLRHRVPLSLVMFDIDHFKKVNDTYGHMAGDAVLCATANVVKTSVPPEYLFARVGGEEFAVLCPNTSLAQAKLCAERIRVAVAENMPTFEEKSLPVTASLGVAEFKAGSEEEPEALYGRADEKLYQAKDSGRNRVCA